jgi:hypothetical protein
MSPDEPPMPDDDQAVTRMELEAELSQTALGRKLLAFATAGTKEPLTRASRAETPLQLPETDAAITAAISHTFSLDSMAGPDNKGSTIDEIATSNQEEAAAILANSASLMIAGRRRLRLSADARADLLHRVFDSDRFRRLLKQAADEDLRDFDAISKDQIRLPSAWLRSFLQKTHGELEQAPSTELRAAMEALEQLRQVKIESLALPSLDDVRRLLELSELLEPLRILVGMTGGWDSTPQKDRFVGRQKEISMLRAFVDELKYESVGERIGRFFNRAYKGAQYFFGIRDESVMFVEAQGGLGKSTLMAKFMIDHARNQSTPFPFVYLDFDRAVLYPREPRQLLIETARQVALQFPEIHDDVRGLNQRLIDQLPDATGGTTTNPFDEFRHLIQSKITRKSRAFLVVLDTMEVIQYDPKALAGVVTFVSELSGQYKGADFPELKIVAAGRADVPDLRTRADVRSTDRHLVLKPLVVEEARDMANRVGRDLLGVDWRLEWGGLVVGRDSDPPERREPLAIRVAVELIRAAKPDKRQALAEDIGRDGEAADEGFIGRLYERRILDHVQDPAVQKLAWPGLVVRRVTRDIIREKLADLCGLERDQTDAVFASLANEVWMVEELERGNVLKHRPDLRARTLPLMQRRNRELFAKVNEAARDYFWKRRRTAEDHAEWLYHRLLGGEDPEKVDQDWTDDMTRLLAGAAEDFARGSAARDYLLARTADRLLPRDLIERLSPRLALDHVARTAVQLGSFDDTQIEPILSDLSARIGVGASSSYPHPVRGIILVKTGRWTFEAPLEGGEGAWATHAAFAKRYKRARSLESDPYPSEKPERSSALFSWAFEATDDDFGIRTGLIRVIIQDLATARILGSPRAHYLDQLLDKTLSGSVDGLDVTDLAALRTAVVFGTVSSAAAARAWLRLQDRLGQQIAPTISLAELGTLLQAGKSIRTRVEKELAPEFERLRIQWQKLLSLAASNQQQQAIRISDEGLRAAVLRIIQDMLTHDFGQPMQTIRRFFSVRDEDWSVPLGYAVARALSSGTMPGSLMERLTSHEPPRVNILGLSIGGKLELPSDPLQIVRRADEASDLAEVVRVILGTVSDPELAADLRLLLKHYGSWRRNIDRILAAAKDEPNEIRRSQVP